MAEPELREDIRRLEMQVERLKDERNRLRDALKIQHSILRNVAAQAADAVAQSAVRMHGVMGGQA